MENSEGKEEGIKGKIQFLEVRSITLQKSKLKERNSGLSFNNTPTKKHRIQPCH